MVESRNHPSTLKNASSIFLIGLSVRLTYTILFLNKYGWHSVRLEFWHWYAVAKNCVYLSPLDPTKWLFDLTGLFFRGENLIYGLMILGSALSSMAAVVVFLLAKELYDKRTGFLAGIIYALIPKTVYASTAAFIHDLVLIPVALSAVLLFVYASRNAVIWKKIFFLLASALLLCLGAIINSSAYVFLMVILSCIIYSFVLGYSKKTGLGEEKTNKYFVASYILSAIIISLLIGPQIFEYFFGQLSQGRYGSMDESPLNLEWLWGRVGLLLFFLLPGAYIAYRKKDMVTLPLILFGALTTFFVIRGSRILIIGLVIAAASAIVNWRKEMLKPSLTAYLSILALTLLLYNPSTETAVIIYLPSIALTAAFIFLSEKQKTQLIVPGLIITCLFLSYVTCVLLPSYYMVSEEEYKAMKWFFENRNSSSKILLSWDRGDMACAIADMKPVSNFGFISWQTHNLLWLPEKQAAENLSRRGVKYVLTTSRDFTAYIGEDAANFQIKGLVSKPENPEINDIYNSTIYKIVYEPENLTYFKKIYGGVDGATGIYVNAYEVSSI